jgi:hypothetical protein
MPTRIFIVEYSTHYVANWKFMAAFKSRLAATKWLAKECGAKKSNRGLIETKDHLFTITSYDVKE